MRAARESGLFTVGLTGKGGGRMADWCDVLMAVPSVDTPTIPEIHLLTYHAMCAAIEDALIKNGQETAYKDQNSLGRLDSALRDLCASAAPTLTSTIAPMYIPLQWR